MRLAQVAVLNSTATGVFNSEKLQVILQEVLPNRGDTDFVDPFAFRELILLDVFL